MAEREEYMLSKPAEWIDEVFKGAVVGTKAMPELSEQFKAQFRDNIGATSSDASWQPKGYFDTVEELQATVTAPKPGDAYGVGLEPPYNIWVWDGLRGRWLNNGPIKGMDGKDGSDAQVTAENIEAALGYVPADAENVGVPDGSVGTTQLADGAVTKEKLADDIELGVSMPMVWQNAQPSSDFGAQDISLDFSEYDYVAYSVGYNNSGFAASAQLNIAKLGEGVRTLICLHSYYMNSANALLVPYREAYISADRKTLTFTDAFVGGSKDNSKCIPMYIWAWKEN